MYVVSCIVFTVYCTLYIVYRDVLHVRVCVCITGLGHVLHNVGGRQVIRQNHLDLLLVGRAQWEVLWLMARVFSGNRACCSESVRREPIQLNGAHDLMTVIVMDSATDLD